MNIPTQQNSLLIPALFPELLIHRQHRHTAMARPQPVSPPANPRAAQAYHQGLPCAGWATRVVCQQRPSADREKVLNVGQNALRETAHQLSGIAPENFEAAALEVVRRAMEVAYGKLSWPTPEPVSPPPDGLDGADVAPVQPVVMVAEDCPVTRFSLCRQLRKAGIKPLIVANGAEVLLLTTLCQPELILMDVMMGKLGGVQLCTMLKRSRLTNTVPVILLSEASDLPETKSGFASGASDFITKPFEFGEVVARVRVHLENRRLQRQLELANRELRQALAPQGGMPSATSTKLDRPRVDLGGEIEIPPALTPKEKIQAASPASVFGEGEVLTRCAADLGPVLRLAAWIVTPMAASKNIELRLDVPEMDLVSHCDDIRIQRVTESLLTNAIKFSPRGSAITLSARHEAGLIRVWVNDAGPGVRITEQPKLFKQRTRTATEALELENRGVLELAACRQIIQAHHGLITMHNLDPHGAHFEFCLPAMAAKHVATAA